MPVELNLVESTTTLDTTVVTVVLESASEPGPAGVGVPTGGTAGQVLTKDSGTDYDTSWQDATGGGGGGVTDADYLVGTAHSGLSAEIVVGTSPGGELGGTWASPTVDATHSGSSHASVQAAAEATAASALTTHSADTTAVHGIADTSALALTANVQPLDSDLTAIAALTTTSFGRGLLELANQAALLSAAGAAASSHVHAGEDITSGTVADARIASTIARDSEVTSAIATHEADTTSVHGITDTSALALTADVVTKALYDANTVLAADSDNTPAAVTMGASTILARLAAGNIKAASTSEIRTLLDVPTNAEAILDTLFAAKGDLITATANDTPTILTAGTDGHVLTADSAQSAGIKWAAAASGTGTKAYAIQLLNPRTSTLAGNSFFTVLGLTDWDAGHWEFLLDVEGKIYGLVRVPPSYASGGAIKLEIGANATSGVTRLQVGTKAVADGESMNPTLTDETAQDITVPGTAYLRKAVSFTLTETLAASDLLIVEIFHDGDHANDTLAVNTLLFGAWLEVTA